MIMTFWACDAHTQRIIRGVHGKARCPAATPRSDVGKTHVVLNLVNVLQLRVGAYAIQGAKCWGVDNGAGNLEPWPEAGACTVCQLGVLIRCALPLVTPEAEGGLAIRHAYARARLSPQAHCAVH